MLQADECPANPGDWTSGREATGGLAETNSSSWTSVLSKLQVHRAEQPDRLSAADSIPEPMGLQVTKRGLNMIAKAPKPGAPRASILRVEVRLHVCMQFV